MTWLQKEISFSQKKLHIIAYLLLFVPYYIFAFSYLRLIYSLPVGILLTAGLYFLFKNEDNEKKVNLPLGGLILVCATAIVISILSGQGGYMYQKGDQHWRNAIFHDMVVSPWPVTYYCDQITGYLIYYFNFWMIPALAGKLFLPFGENASMEAGFAAMAIFSAFYLFIILLNFLNCFKKHSIAACVIILAVFVSFSGMDFPGYVIKGEKPLSIGYIFNELKNFEWWCNNDWQYTSMAAQMSWVYNQALPAWLCMALFLNENTPKRYGAIVCGCLICSPFVSVGIGLPAACIAVCSFITGIKNNTCRSFFKDVFSPENILICLSVAPVMALFYLSNSTVNNTVVTGAAVKHGFWMLDSKVMCYDYLLFVLCEFGLLSIFLYRYFRSALYWISVFMLLILPAIFIISRDFCMRVSIPYLFILMFFCIRFFTEDCNWKGKKDRITATGLIVILLIGAATPALDSAVTLLRVKMHPHRANALYSYANMFGRELTPVPFRDMKQTNFVSFSADKSFFFSHLAKKSSGYADSKDNRKVRSLLSEQPENEDLLKGEDAQQVYIGQYLNWIYIIGTEKQVQNMTFSLCSANADSDVLAKVDKLKEECFTIQNMQNNTGRDLCIPCCISTLPGDGFLVILLDGNKSGTVDIPPECKDQVSLYLPEEQVVILNIKMLNEISQSSPDRRMGLYKW